MKRKEILKTIIIITIFILPLSSLFAQEDTTPPELVELSFLPTTIDVSAGPQDVIFTIRITDDPSGFSSGWFGLDSPSGKQNRSGSMGLGNRIFGDDQDGTYEVTVTFPQYSESGIWHITILGMYDKVGNRIQLSENDLIAMEFPTELNVSENSPPVAACKDIAITADENCQASIVPEDVDGGSYDPDEGDTITLSVDNIGPFSLGEHYINLTVTDSHAESDTCTATVTVTDDTPPTIQLSDPICVNVGEDKMANKLTVSAEDNCSEPVDPSINKIEVYNKRGILVRGKGVYDIFGNDIFVYPNAKGWSITVIATAVDESGNTTTQTINKSLIKCEE